jgi:hypothetical protein
VKKESVKEKPKFNLDTRWELEQQGDFLTLRAEFYTGLRALIEDEGKLASVISLVLRYKNFI